MKLDTGIILWINESCTLYICTHTICILLRTFLFIFLLFHFAFLSPSLFPSPTVILKLYDLFIMMPMMRIIDTDHRSINHYTSACRMSVSFLLSIYFTIYISTYLSIYLSSIYLSIYPSSISLLSNEDFRSTICILISIFFLSYLYFFHLTMYISIYLSFIYAGADNNNHSIDHLPTFLIIFLSVYLFTYLSLLIPTFLSFYVSILCNILLVDPYSYYFYINIMQFSA